MYDNTRSYLSRFSGLLLFLLTLAVVAVLVFLTIRAARDGGDTDNTTTVDGTSEEFIIEDTEIDGLNQSDDDASVGVVTTPDADENVDDRSSSSDSEQVASSETDALPGTSDDSEVAGTTTQSTSNDESNNNDPLNSSSVTNMAVTGPSEAELPNTGLGQSVAVVSFGVFVVAYMGLSNRARITALLRG